MCLMPLTSWAQTAATPTKPLTVGPEPIPDFSTRRRSPIVGHHVGPIAHEFVFARLAYGNSSGFGWPRWQADWPEAETHFNAGLQRLTAIDVDEQSVVVDLATDILFDYPWLYAVEVGSLTVDDEAAERLREYLLRGGFLMVDDFHGAAEWAQFSNAMKRVFPNRRIDDLVSDDETFHVLYDLSVREQIPGVRALLNGRTWENDGREAKWRGIRDDYDRVMVAINFNQDIGDAWEHADDPFYPENYAAMAYRIGINYVMYALTH